MNPYQQGQPGFPQQQYFQNTGFINPAPQSFGNPMPMTGIPQGFPQQNMYQPAQGQPNMGYPTPQTNQGYTQPGSVQILPSQGYSQAPQPGYPQSVQMGYPSAQNAYSPAQMGLAQHTQAGYPNQQAHSVPGLVSPKLKSKPTVVPVKPFEPRDDAAKLHKAMKGLGTNEKTIIEVLTKRTNEQRLRIEMEYKTLFGRDLVLDLKKETSGQFQNLLVALMTPLPQFYAKELHDAMAGAGTEEDALIEFLCMMTNPEINQLKIDYAAKYGKRFEDDLSGDTSGHFKKLLAALAVGNRSTDYHVDQRKAKEDANSLLKAGEKRIGTDESMFITIFTSRSFPQLAEIFKQYKLLKGHAIDIAIKAEFSGNMEKALKAIIKAVENKPLFFAERLHKSMKGIGTNDRQLIRIMVTRCEIDLGDIADSFQSRFNGTLKSWIEGDCSGHYKKCLIGLLGL